MRNKSISKLNGKCSSLNEGLKLNSPNNKLNTAGFNLNINQKPISQRPATPPVSPQKKK